MKIGIITFYFAHNYGAMLQAFALKEYLKEIGHHAEIVPYYPKHFQIQYKISPLIKGITLKKRIRNFLFFLKHVSQANLFEKFKQEYIFSRDNKKEIGDVNQLQKYCKFFDYVIYGSDQIWNEQIIHADEIYFGGKLENRKISYAASMGNSDYTQKQLEYINKHLSTFDALSVREPGNKRIIEENSDNEVDVVCDPVFLFTKDEWEKHETMVKICEPYILMYMLEDDERLLELAYEYAEKNNLVIYEIHPTLGLKHRRIKQLKKVGPREFLYLLDHAEYVCTNSFHAVSFSIIYRKKFIHIPNPKSPERTFALLSKLNLKGMNGREFIEDLSTCNYENLEKFIIHSKEYIAEKIN